MKKAVLFFAATAFFFAAPAWAETPAPSALIAAGSGVNLGITRLLVEAFMEKRPDVKIEVPASIGSNGAIKAVKDGAVTLGLLSRPLKETEKEQGLSLSPYARAAIVLVANKAATKDEGFSSQELVAIYKGTKNKWKDGKDIIVFAREPYDSGNVVLEQKIPGFKEAYTESHAAKRWTVFFTDQESNEAIVKTPYAFGVSDLGMIKTERLDVKALKLDGVEASSETLESGAYPLSRDLFFLYKAGELPEAAKAFLAFVASEEGKAILRENAYQPL